MFHHVEMVARHPKQPSLFSREGSTAQIAVLLFFFMALYTLLMMFVHQPLEFLKGTELSQDAGGCKGGP